MGFKFKKLRPKLVEKRRSSHFTT